MLMSQLSWEDERVLHSTFFFPVLVDQKIQQFPSARFSFHRKKKNTWGINGVE